jgi:hypothetical protein
MSVIDIEHIGATACLACQTKIEMQITCYSHDDRTVEAGQFSNVVVHLISLGDIPCGSFPT